jgi:hypothetical protein
MPLDLVYEKTKTRQFYTTIQALDPHDGGNWDLLVSPKTLEWAAKGGAGKAKELAYTVRWSLLHPITVHLGVRDWDREISEDNWLCYVARPGFAYNLKTGDKIIPAWDDEVFLVFVNDERVYYQSYWCKCDAVHSHLPVDYEGRFRERVWFRNGM